MPKIFESLSARIYAWTASRDPSTRALHRQVAEEVAARLKKGRVLDVGTGPGLLPLKIGGMGGGALEVVGVDLSEGMIAAATRKLRREAHPQPPVTFQLGDVEALPFPDAAFHLVVSTLSYHHWGNPPKALSEIRRVLGRGGEAWIYDIWRDPPKEVDEALKRDLGRGAALILRYVRRHSSLTRAEAERIVKERLGGFESGEVEERGAFLKMRLTKKG